MLMFGSLELFTRCCMYLDDTYCFKMRPKKIHLWVSGPPPKQEVVSSNPAAFQLFRPKKLSSRLDVRGPMLKISKIFSPKKWRKIFCTNYIYVASFVKMRS
jgi:hypothetical protein